MRGRAGQGLILPTATLYLLPLLLLFSVFLLLRGHNQPGGGFSGGLVAGAGFALLATAAGVRAARRTLRVDPRSLMGAGLLVMLVSGLPGLLAEAPGYLAAVWLDLEMPDGALVSLGTPLIFDVGVYLAVTGTVLTVVFALEEEEDEP